MRGGSMGGRGRGTIPLPHDGISNIFSMCPSYHNNTQGFEEKNLAQV